MTNKRIVKCEGCGSRHMLEPGRGVSIKCEGRLVYTCKKTLKKMLRRKHTFLAYKNIP